MSAVSPKRIAVIGCGAIAEDFFLPVLSTRPDLCSQLWLIDPNQERLTATGKQFGIETMSTCLADVLDNIDAAVIASPHDTHHQISLTLMRAGKHMICEKPLTTTPEAGIEIVEAAAAAGVVLMTNNWRRACPAFIQIQEIVASGSLGRPLSVTWVEGKKFNWPTKSGFYFTQRARSGLPPPGIMLDIGSHVVDLLCWWFGHSSIIECKTDSLGGPEARATMVLDYSGMTATVELSYYQKMSNYYLLEFEGGSIRGDAAGDPRRFDLCRNGEKDQTIVCDDRMKNPAALMISNFIDAIAGVSRPVVTGRDVLPSIQAIHSAYLCASPYEAPWLPRELHV